MSRISKKGESGVSMHLDVGQEALKYLLYVPFFGSIGLVVYALYGGKISLRGNVIRRDAQTSTYWWAIALILLFISLPSFLIATSH